ncbi:MAG: Hpt domain-containing protein [Halieaceae bacterium]|uniref:Hpt domain-containing protein n=1 Tax=Haliea alexandrii TaxID=2448162 RepID=UPI000F0B2DEF|nr:Hpt domain-containing protein [Haliea alexandrii]MCR9183795.1 Hpt domain-containing protein [Halieaceae bacterium]
MTTEKAVFDSSHLPHSLELDDWEVLADFYGTFLQQLDALLLLIEPPSLPMSLDEQRHHAHKLGSSCRTVGAHALASLFESLEALCRDAATEETREQLLANIVTLAKTTRGRVASHLAAGA